MAELPSGTVTFLFTDIERSTQTVAALGDEAYADALETHRQALREAFKAHGGVEVGTEGDAFFVAFARASDAVDAAVEGQRSLSDHPLRVRMGLHTGEALVRGGDYIGHDVHKAKRISDAGHGGQILLSQTTADLVGDAVALTDLGPHRLKDLEEAQRIYQVGADEFPRLRSLDAFRHTLPAQRSSFVGREREITDVISLLDESRLVTLTGIGGCGKTRLALQVGAELLDRYPDGVFFADLAPVSDPTVLPQTIASAVGMSLGGLGESSPMTVDELLLDYLSRRRCLVVVDNCEHLLDDCAGLVDGILGRCPDVTVLATSRESLEVEGEQSWRVPSMSVPDDAADAASSEAVSLFKSRAQAADPSFDLTPDNIEAVAEICRRLDGIPLAIEFAAARVTHLAPGQIADRLGDMFRLLTGGRRRVQRQQTLQAALDWSYDLLAEEERVMLRRLAVFSGSFGLSAAEGVCAGDGIEPTRVVELLGSLVSKSLVATEPAPDETRYRLLETVRLYAEEKLREHGEADRYRAAHRDHYLAWVESIPPERAYLETETVNGFVVELGNIRAALRWSLAEGRRDLVGRMAGRLGSLWGNRGLHEEGYEWFNEALRHPDAIDRATLVECLSGQAFCAMLRADGTSLDLARRAVDAARGEASPGLVTALALTGVNLSVVAAATSSDELAAESRRWAEDAVALARRIGPELEGWALVSRGWTELDLGDIEAAARYFADAADRLSASGGRPKDITPMLLGGLAVARHLAADDTGAKQAAEASLAAMTEPRPDPRTRLRPSGQTGVVVGLAAAGEFGGAHEAAAEFMELARASGVPLAVNEALIACGVLAFLRGDAPRASRLLAAGRHAGGASRVAGPAFRSPSGYALYRHYTLLVREALGPDEARRHRDEGAAMSLDEAIAYALEDDPDA